MRPKSLILLALALGCGLIASIGINQVLANRSSGPATAETVDILVAAMDIPMGDPMSPEFVRVQAWPKAQMPEGAITSLEEIEERRTRTKFFPGEPILQAKLFGRGEAGESATDLIPKGYRVLPVKVDAVTGASGMILPGDRVDLMVHVTEDQHRGIPRTTTRTFLQNVKVFAVDNMFNQRGADGEQSISAKTISVLVTPEQAEVVAMATQLGSVTLVMRGPEDGENNMTDGASPTDIFGDLTALAAPQPTGPAPDPNEAANLLDILRQQRDAQVSNSPAVPPFRMVLIKGQDATAVEFNDGDVLPVVTSNVNAGGAGFGLGLPGAVPAETAEIEEPTEAEHLPELPLDEE